MKMKYTRKKNQIKSIYPQSPLYYSTNAAK